MRVDALLFLGIAAAGGAAAAVHPGPAVAAAVAFVVMMRPRVERPVLWLAIVLFAVGAVRATWALEATGRAHLEAAELLSPPGRCEIVAEVTRSPVVLRREDRRAHSLGEARLDVEVRSGRCGEREVAGLRARLYAGPEELGRGDVVRLEARLAAVRAFDNPELSDPRIRMALNNHVASGSVTVAEVVREGQGILRGIDRARVFIRRRIEATYTPAIAPFARALVLGESNLREEDGEAFRVSGLSHLLAVSGTHLIIAVVALGAALRSLLVRIVWLAGRLDVGRIVAAFCLVASWLYAELAGGGGSAYRAAAMLSCAMLVKLCGWKPDASRSFAWSILGGAIAEPLVAFDLSFALSVAATAGLLLSQRPVAAVRAWLGGITGALVGTMLTTLGATAACAPVILCVGPQVPVLGVFANVIAAPIGELAALPVALAHCVLFWAPGAEKGAAIVAGGALSLVRLIAHGTSASSWAALDLPPPTAWQLAAVAVGAAWCLVRDAGRRVPIGASVILVLVLELVARHRGAPTGELRVTMLDVGQGDAILVDLPDGSLMLVDAGGLVGSPIDTGSRVVVPVLRARRRHRIDVAVLSHPHPDHYGGLFAVLEEFPVGEIWDSGLSTTRPDGILARALRDQKVRGVALRDAPSLCASPRHFGPARVDVLGPCPSFDDLRSANDNSLVLRISLGERAALLTGDAEAEQEALLVAEHGAALRADFLKVGHHGSRTSSTAPFLAAVRPELAGISCGVRNRFGHPHEIALDRLEGASIPVLRTDRGGAILWRTDGATVRVAQRK
jgi:competence protein ComEC